MADTYYYAGDVVGGTAFWYDAIIMLNSPDISAPGSTNIMLVVRPPIGVAFKLNKLRVYHDHATTAQNVSLYCGIMSKRSQRIELSHTPVEGDFESAAPLQDPTSIAKSTWTYMTITAQVIETTFTNKAPLILRCGDPGVGKTFKVQLVMTRVKYPPEGRQ